MNIPPEQLEVAQFLRNLAGVDPIETHISAVYVGAQTVWKLKKAVRLPFLDFTAVAARHHFVQRELELNRNAAPDIYRDVAAVTRGTDGRLCLTTNPGTQSALDWVLRMAPVPRDDFLEAIALRGGLTPDLLDAPGDCVASYHGNLRSDEIRKRLFDVLPEQRLTNAAYSKTANTSVNASLLGLAKQVVAGGHSLIADATFLDRKLRDAVSAAAHAAGMPFVGVWLSAPDTSLEARLTARLRDASDATHDVLHQAAARDTGPIDWIKVDATDARLAASAVREAVALRVGEPSPPCAPA